MIDTRPLWTIADIVTPQMAKPIRHGRYRHHRISIDSRDIKTGDLFVALPGTVLMVILGRGESAGASAALVSN